MIDPKTSLVIYLYSNLLGGNQIYMAKQAADQLLLDLLTLDLDKEFSSLGWKDVQEGKKFVAKRLKKTQRTTKRSKLKVKVSKTFEYIKQAKTITL